MNNTPQPIFDNNYLLNNYPEVVDILLRDQSSGKNIIWATDDYVSYGDFYRKECQITKKRLLSQSSNVIRPRHIKRIEEQWLRSKNAAEVFTPSWICNKQNNLVDEAWFGYKDVFNVERMETWSPTSKILFFNGRTWESYVLDVRLEISCGEGPYLTSRYDAVTGEQIPIAERIGLLDRKLRVISENVSCKREWEEWCIKACQSIYAYDFQGDNVFIARENVLFTILEFYYEMFSNLPNKEIIVSLANIISWNVFQMDGRKFVIPFSCHDIEDARISLFDDEIRMMPCPGCSSGDIYTHNGIYCLIKDWNNDSVFRFVDLTNNEEGKHYER